MKNGGVVASVADKVVTGGTREGGGVGKIL